MINAIPDMAWAADIMTGRKPFPTMQKPKKGEGFKEVLDKEMEKKAWEKESAESASTMSCKT